MLVDLHSADRRMGIDEVDVNALCSSSSALNMLPLQSQEEIEFSPNSEIDINLMQRSESTQKKKKEERQSIEE